MRGGVGIGRGIEEGEGVGEGAGHKVAERGSHCSSAFNDARGRKLQTPNSKPQTPKKSQAPNPKTTAMKVLHSLEDIRERAVLRLATWCFCGAWCLEVLESGRTLI